MQHVPVPLDDILQAIEHFRSRTAMYIYPVDVANTVSFFSGFEAALRAFGIRRDAGTWWKVQEARGWKQAPVGPVPQMEERGLTVRQIIDELIDIEIEVLRQSNATGQ